MISMIKCVDCKTDIVWKESHQRRLCDGCSRERIRESCRKSNARKRMSRPNSYSLKCIYCYSEFKGKTPNKKYCSNTCRTKFFNIPKTITATEERIDRLYIKLFQLREKIGQ